MYCSHCGHPAAGNFCAECGVRLRAAAEPIVATIVGDGKPFDWRHEVRYDLLMQAPEVRARIAASAALAKKRLSGEQFLAIAEKACEPLLAGVPIATVAALVGPMYARWGIGAQKTRVLECQRPVGEVLVAVLCSLAAAGQPIQRVRQGDDGCVIEAELPSDWRSFAGELLVSVQRRDAGARVEGVAKTMGQLFDWGKNQQALDRLRDDLERWPAAA